MNELCLGNKILRINLSTGEIIAESISRLASKFLGGRGVNQKILIEELGLETRVFDSDNLLAIGSGRLAGTLAPCANRLSIDSKNAFHGGIGSANMGGHFASELKFAGYDNIILRGCSEEPVYLWIHDGEVEFRDASAIWGKSTTEAVKFIRTDLRDDDIHVIGIGQAGEKLVRMSCVFGDETRASGRCGLGAVMGSKKLKAIAVKGTGGIRVADPDGFMIKVQEYWNKIKKASRTRTRERYGTLQSAQTFNLMSATPFRNFQDEFVKNEEMEKLSPEKFERFLIKRFACAACPIGCHHVYQIMDGPYAGLVCTKVEANTIWNFGTKLDILSPEAILISHQLCSQYGLDIDGASSVIAWIIECFEKGILTKADTDGMELRWGDPKIVWELLRKIANREGIGEILGEGVKRASDVFGRESKKLALHIKGQDLIEPLRYLKAWALGVVVSPRGGTHTRGAAGSVTRNVPPEVAERVWGIRLNEHRSSYDGAPELVRYYEQLHAILDSLGICFFASNWSGLDLLHPEEIAEMLSHALGYAMDGVELMRIGERIHTVEKAFNVRHAGFSRKDDYPPERLMDEPIKSGPGFGEKLDRKNWELLLNRYYTLHGWDTEHGWPKKETLFKLGLEDIAHQLEEQGRLLY